MIPTWFLYIGGFSLILLGGMQIQQRPREKDASVYQRFINVGTLWSLVCISVGIGMVVMALGYWSPFDRPALHPPARHHH